MKFSELPYKRPALDPIDEKYASLPAQMEAAENLETLLSLLKEFEAFVSEVMTMYNLSYIRHTVDTRDAFTSRKTPTTTPAFRTLSSCAMKYAAL